MNLSFTPAEESFRLEVRDWMNRHLTGEFACLKHRGGPGDEDAFTHLRKKWEQELAKGKWIGLALPKSMGGRECTLSEQVIFYEEYARAGGPGRMGHIGEGLVAPTLAAFGTTMQQTEFIPDILAGKTFWAQGYSEPNAGSDLSNVQTKAVQNDRGDWIVTGQKIWTSLAHESDWIFVLARSDPNSKAHKGLIFLLLPLNQSNIIIRPIRQITGTAEFNEVFFDGAIASKEHVIGQPGDGWKIAMGLLGFERGASTLGQQMQFSHELQMVIELAKERKRLTPAIRERLLRAWIGLKVMRYHALRILSKITSDGQLPPEGLGYKYFWSNWHRSLGELAMDVLGTEALYAISPSSDPRIMRLQQVYFFSRSDTIYAGTNEIQLNIIAERGLGLPKEMRYETHKKADLDR